MPRRSASSHRPPPSKAVRRHLEEDPVDDEAEADHEERVEWVHGAGVGVDVEARGPGVAGEDAEEGHKGHVELAEVGRAPLGEEVDPDDGVCAAARDSGPCDPGLRPGRIDSERVRVSRRWRQRARAALEGAAAAALPGRSDCPLRGSHRACASFECLGPSLTRLCSATELKSQDLT